MSDERILFVSGAKGLDQVDSVKESADILQGLGRAKALASLLANKAKVVVAKGIEKAKIVKTILELREKLGFGIDEKEIDAAQTKQPAEGNARVSTSQFFSVREKGVCKSAKA